MSEWIKCTERMPELDDDGFSEMVLVFSSSKNIYQNYVIDNEWAVDTDITHWMPLPQPPKEEV